MCGYDLRTEPRRFRRVSWIDVLLVIAILTVVSFWWRSVGRPVEQSDIAQGSVTLPANLPTPTATPVPTLQPTPSPAPTEPIVPNPVIHQVQPGETLLAIAQRYNVSVVDLQAANELGDALIRIGDELIIPGEFVLPTEDRVESVASVFNYTVQPGDTVVSIAIRFGTTVEAILSANNMTPSDFIQPQQVLAVPVSELPREVLVSGTAPIELANQNRESEPAIYSAPRLIGPLDEESISRKESVLFRWLSVDILAPNEWYVLRIWSVDGTREDPPGVWTKATSYRLNSELAPDSGEKAEYLWQVSVVRVLPDQGQGRSLQSASYPSDIRPFVWE